MAIYGSKTSTPKWRRHVSDTTDGIASDIVTLQSDLNTAEADIVDLQDDKADLVASATANDIALLNSSGNPIDSGIGLGDVVQSYFLETATDYNVSGGTDVGMGPLITMAPVYDDGTSNFYSWITADVQIAIANDTRGSFKMYYYDGVSWNATASNYLIGMVSTGTQTQYFYGTVTWMKEWKYTHLRSDTGGLTMQFRGHSDYGNTVTVRNQSALVVELIQ